MSQDDSDGHNLPRDHNSENGSQTESSMNSNDQSDIVTKVKEKYTDYIPSSVHTNSSTGSTNTISIRPMSSGSKHMQSLMNSNEYSDSKALHDLPKRKKVELELATSEKIDDDKANLTESNKLNDPSELARRVTAEENSTKDERENNTAEDGKQMSVEQKQYIPSQFGSCHGTTSTCSTPCMARAEKEKHQCTNTPNSRGSVSHNRSAEK